MLTAVDFKPYEFVPEVSRKVNRLCLRSSRSFSVPRVSLTSAAKLRSHVRVQGRAEVRLTKQCRSGLLNVLSPNSRHCWNQRWCVLDGLHLQVWKDVEMTDNNPLHCLDLCSSIRAGTYVLRPSMPEECSRPRSFGLTSGTIPANMVYFAADKLSDLNQWLEHLNRVLRFVAEWLSVANDSIDAPKIEVTELVP